VKLTRATAAIAPGAIACRSVGTVKTDDSPSRSVCAKIGIRRWIFGGDPPSDLTKSKVYFIFPV
jgi:hypothetical protein